MIMRTCEQSIKYVTKLASSNDRHFQPNLPIPTHLNVLNFLNDLFRFFSNSQTLSVSNAVTDNNVNELFRLRRFVFINACVVCCPSTKSENENELQNLCKRWTPHASKQRNSIEMVTFISGIRYLFDMEQYFSFFHTFENEYINHILRYRCRPCVVLRTFQHAYVHTEKNAAIK